MASSETDAHPPPGDSYDDHREAPHTGPRTLAGDAWDYDRRQLVAQAHVRREAAKVVMNQADTIQREDAVFDDH